MSETIENYADFEKYKFNSKDDFSDIAKSEAKILGVLYSRPKEMSTNERIRVYGEKLERYLKQKVNNENLSHVNAYYNFEESDFFEQDYFKEKINADLRIEDENCLKWFKNRKNFKEKLKIRKNEISYLPNTELRKVMLNSYSNEIEALNLDLGNRDMNDAYNSVLKDVLLFGNLCVYANNLYEKLLPEILLSNYDTETKAYFTEFMSTIMCYSTFDIETSSIVKSVDSTLDNIDKLLDIEYDGVIDSGMTSEKMDFESVYIFDDKEIKLTSSYDLSNIRPEMAEIAMRIENDSRILYESGLRLIANSLCSLLNRKIFDGVRDHSDLKIKRTKEVLI